MQSELAEALLRAIIDAEAYFLEAAELVAAGAINQDRYQAAADRFHGAIDRAAAAIDLAAAYRDIGSDAEIECERFRELTAGELRDVVAYIGDYQG